MQRTHKFDNDRSPVSDGNFSPEKVSRNLIVSIVEKLIKTDAHVPREPKIKIFKFDFSVRLKPYDFTVFLEQTK